MNGIFTPLTVDDEKRIAIVLLLIFFNFVFAVVGAIMRGGFDATAGGFDIKKLPQVFYLQVLPYFVGMAFFEVFLHLLPPSSIMGSLFGGTVAAPAAPLPGATSPIPVEPGAGWQWLDPTVLWITYGVIVVNLAYKTFTNLVYLFGKGITLAQVVASRTDKPA